MNIAITGDTGFIGSSFIQKLETNSSYTIFPFDKSLYSLSSSESLKKFVMDKDIILHLAGITDSENIEACYKVNMLGTLHLLEALSLYGKKGAQFIFSSSFAIYEEQTTKEKLNEDTTKIFPRNHYGISKKFAEDIIENYNKTKKIPTRILRIANPYGPSSKNGYTGIISLLIDKIYNNEYIEISGDGTQTRDFIYIDDVTEAIIKVIGYQNDSLLINICSGKDIQIIEVVRKLEKLIGKKANLKYNKQNTQPGYWIGDTEKASKEIQFTATTDIDTGLAQTVAWYKERNKK